MFWTRRAAFALFAAAALPLGVRAARAAEEEESNIPNLFISPCGEPFRAAANAPYPVGDWFRGADTNADGKLDHGEFIADAERFFKRLDVNGDGVLSRLEISAYEKNVAPEIVSLPEQVGWSAGRLLLAQYGVPGAGRAAPPIDPDAAHRAQPTPKAPGLNESMSGASPYSFFEEPEPLLAADFNVNGIVTRENFLKVADGHFTSLDEAGRGYLTLQGLPTTTVQKLLRKDRRRT
ncbi:MAG TPA: hypothetical protein VGH15_14810 [Caulobacteraceae bacterium]|jgi:hypothetical protein